MNLTKTNWFVKFFACLFFATAIVNTVSIVFEFIPQQTLSKISDAFFDIFFYVIYVASLLFAVGYAVYWHQKEKKGAINSSAKYMWMLGVLRYWLAFDICTYGFAKILGTQFHTPYYRKDMLLGEVNGFTLTWFYYGYSYTMAIIIACVQIGGSILLLFRRTVLLGTMVLLPVMVNILLINLFYDIAAGAFINSVLFTAGLIFLLLLHWHLLKALFFRIHIQLPAFKSIIFKALLKIIPVACGFSIIFYYVKTDVSSPEILGAWDVKMMIKNGDTLSANNWMTDSLSYRKIYFDGVYGCAFSPNPYRYKAKEARHGSYTYDERTKLLKAILSGSSSKTDTLSATITLYNKDSLMLRGIYLQDSISIWLKKVKDKKS